jgi:RNA polymerase sigma-70 factor (ECF subfamily)
VLQIILLFAYFITAAEFEKLKTGNHSVFEKVYKQYSRLVYSYLVHKLNSKTVADDLLSDTFFQMYKYIHTVRNMELLKSWIMTIARNVLYRHISKKVKEQEKVERTMTQTTGLDEQSPEVHILKGEKALLFSEALNNMKDKSTDQYTVLDLKYIQEKSQKEIAKITGKSEGAVEGLLSRARESLKKEVHRLTQQNVYISRQQVVDNG